MQEIVARNEAHKGVQGPSYSRKYERLSREELQKTLSEKDEVIQEMSSQMQGLKAQYEKLLENKRNQDSKMNQLEYNLKSEKEQN